MSSPSRSRPSRTSRSHFKSLMLQRPLCPSTENFVDQHRSKGRIRLPKADRHPCWFAQRHNGQVEPRLPMLLLAALCMRRLLSRRSQSRRLISRTRPAIPRSRLRLRRRVSRARRLQDHVRKRLKLRRESGPRMNAKLNARPSKGARWRSGAQRRLKKNDEQRPRSGNARRLSSANSRPGMLPSDKQQSSDARRPFVAMSRCVSRMRLVRLSVLSRSSRRTLPRAASVPSLGLAITPKVLGPQSLISIRPSPPSDTGRTMRSLRRSVPPLLQSLVVRLLPSAAEPARLRLAKVPLDRRCSHPCACRR